MACTATLKRRHDCLTETPELLPKRRRFVPSQEVMAPSSPSSSATTPPRSPSANFPSLISHMTQEQLHSSIMAELQRTRRKSEDDGHISTRQLSITCTKLLTDLESQIRSEYDKILSERLAEQYENFVKYMQDHLKNQTSNHSMSYVS